MKRILHLIPVCLIFLASLFSFLYYLTLRSIFFQLEILFIMLMPIYYSFSGKKIPFESKEDVIIEGIAMFLSLFVIPGHFVRYLGYFPYDSPFHLFPILCFIISLICYLGKIYFYLKD